MTRTLALAFALTLQAPAAFAADAVLAKIIGPVYFVTGGSSKQTAAVGGEELLFGDTVRTGVGGSAQVVFGDRGAILVRENSSFTLEGDNDRTLLNFKVGEFLIGLRKKLTKGQSFRVRTPAAVASVRGTLFWGKTDQDKNSTYAGFGHTIAVTAQGKTVLVHAGETTTIPFGKAPEEVKPHSIPVAYTDNFKIDGSLQGLEALVDLPKPAAPAPAPKAAPAPKK